eukprot:7377188-Prymnesium_polylepis.3
MSGLDLNVQDRIQTDKQVMCPTDCESLAIRHNETHCARQISDHVYLTNDARNNRHQLLRHACWWRTPSGCPEADNVGGSTWHQASCLSTKFRHDNAQHPYDLTSACSPDDRLR